MIGPAFGDCCDPRVSGSIFGYPSTDSIFVQYENIVIPPGSKVYVQVKNLTDITLLLTQILNHTVTPSSLNLGASYLHLDFFFDPLDTGESAVSQQTSAFSNAITGETINIKGSLIELFVLEAFDEVKNTKKIRVDTGVASYDSPTGNTSFHVLEKKLTNVLSIAADSSIVVALTNQVLYEGGTTLNVNSTLLGQFLTGETNITDSDITVDSSDITVDNTDITVDATSEN